MLFLCLFNDILSIADCIVHVLNGMIIVNGKLGKIKELF